MLEISIIIPHFNRTELLRQTLQSVQAQTYADWEVIIVDDQSEEKEWNLLKSMEAEKIKVMRRESGIKGPSACRNIGAEESVGAYLLFLDADDLLAPQCLQQRIEAMQCYPELDAGIFLMQEFEKRVGDSDRIFNRQIDEHEWANGFIRNENPWNVTCPLWKKESFLKTGGFDENLFYMEDPDLHLRALYSGMCFKTFYNLPPDCYYRVHHFDETKSLFYYHSILFRIRFYQKLTGGFYSKEFVVHHKKDIKAGVNSLIKTFLYSRKNQFPELYKELMDWMKGCGLYSSIETKKYRFLLETGNTNNALLKALKVKGVCYRLLP